jgi:glycosyltransferase involved in cell wall biosynthesis
MNVSNMMGLSMNPDVRQGGQDPVPLITVAMPIFNAGRHLRAAVLSILHQTCTDWELLLIDDGSTDDALQTVADITDSRIRILRDGMNKGLAARLNEAIDMARGRYFARMDQDDVSYPERFSRQLQLLQQDEAVDVAAASAITIGDDDEYIGLLPCPATHEAICARPWQGFCFAHPTWLGKTAWFRKHRYAIPGPYFCEDQELLLRSYGESRFAATEEILFAYRVRAVRNLRRVLRTRWTFFLIQVRHFIRRGRLDSVVLAGGVYVALITRDLWWHYRQKLNLLEHDAPAVDGAAAAAWRKVRNIVSEVG